METNSHAAFPERRSVITLPPVGLAKFGRTAMRRVQAVLRAVQMGRMLSTLSQMSDHQLAQIGISRAEIPDYAQALMAEGQDDRP